MTTPARPTASHLSGDNSVDVVISVLNGVSHIQQAADSALDQVGIDTRLFIVDGGSTDGTPEFVRSWNDPRVTLVAERGHLGPGEARNIGAELGSARWLTFLDSDDLWPRARTWQMLAAIDDPAQDIAVGHMLTFPDGAQIDLTGAYDVADTPLAAVIGGTMFSRDLYGRVGGFDINLSIGEFVDWMARARSAGLREVPVPIVALLRRSHASNASRVRRKDVGDYLTVAVRHRSRQRQQQEAGEH